VSRKQPSAPEGCSASSSSTCAAEADGEQPLRQENFHRLPTAHKNEFSRSYLFSKTSSNRENEVPKKPKKKLSPIPQ